MCVKSASQLFKKSGDIKDPGSVSLTGLLAVDFLHRHKRAPPSMHTVAGTQNVLYPLGGNCWNSPQSLSVDKQCIKQRVRDVARLLSDETSFFCWSNFFSSFCTGVQGIITRQFPKASYLHCNAHVLNFDRHRRSMQRTGHQEYEWFNHPGRLRLRQLPRKADLL